MKARTAAGARRLEEIPNIGPSIAADLRAIGITQPRHLAGKDPYELYARSNRVAGVRQDPCLIDCFISAVRFMEGAPARPWWKYTAERKRHVLQNEPVRSPGRRAGKAGRAPS
jgi:hypothetical protein